MDELISIIVPVYNAEKTLRRCVRSLMGQTYRNLEIILVNDGSKDGSLGLCRKFAGEDARIRVIDQPNGGVSSARNAGLDAATGKFVMFCDSDDWTEPDWCAAMRENYEEGNLTICEIDRDDIPLEKAEHPQILETAQRKDFLHRPLLMCALYNKFFARNVIEDNHLRFPEQLSLGEDFVFVLSYVCAIGGNLRYLHRALYHYDTTGENTLSRKAPSLEQCDCFYQMVTASMEKLGAMDAESVATRDWFVLSHFDRLLTAVSARKDYSISEKMDIAGTIGTLESFKQCRTKVVVWSNPVYCKLFHKKHTKLAMLFLIVRNKVKNRGDIR
jgi:glycosyltransferase involved in cell wall biosynthesis